MKKLKNIKLKDEEIVYVETIEQLNSKSELVVYGNKKELFLVDTVNKTWKFDVSAIMKEMEERVYFYGKPVNTLLKCLDHQLFRSNDNEKNIFLIFQFSYPPEECYCCFEIWLTFNNEIKEELPISKIDKFPKQTKKEKWSWKLLQEKDRKTIIPPETRLLVKKRDRKLEKRYMSCFFLDHYHQGNNKLRFIGFSTKFEIMEIDFAKKAITQVSEFELKKKKYFKYLRNSILMKQIYGNTIITINEAGEIRIIDIETKQIEKKIQMIEKTHIQNFKYKDKINTI